MVTKRPPPLLKEKRCRRNGGGEDLEVVEGEVEAEAEAQLGWSKIMGGRSRREGVQETGTGGKQKKGRDIDVYAY
jgi:hypothetical protein